LNLMTYGWADRFIYGRSQETVSKVRRQARSHPKDVVKPKPPKRVLAVPPDAISASVTAEYARRGWPRTIPAVDKDGKTQEMGYVVIDFDAPAGSVAQLGTEIARSLYRQGDE